MQSPNSQIAIFNKEGSQVSTKPRSKVDKQLDILKTTIVLIINDKLEILVVKTKDSAWPDKWGGSCAGLVRDKEDSLKTAERTLQRELSISVEPTFISEGYYEFDNIKRHLALYSMKTNEARPNREDFTHSKWASVSEIETLIENNHCMPTFTLAFRELQKNGCF